MLSLSKSESRDIVNKLLECQADVDDILLRLQDLQLYDCGMSLREVAKVLDVSKTRIQQIESKALKKLKRELRMKGVA